MLGHSKRQALGQGVSGLPVNRRSPEATRRGLVVADDGRGIARATRRSMGRGEEPADSNSWDEGREK